MSARIIFFSSLLFLFFTAFCFILVDPHLTLNMQYLRVHYYIPFKILSIVISPVTHLTLWTSLFVWLLFIKKNDKLSILLYPLVASMILTNTVVRLVKYFFGRSRPDLLILNGIYGLKPFSFDQYFSSLPSGHSATIAVFFAFLCFIHPKHTFWYILLSLAISMSRVVIGAHYLSDILLGNFIGFLMTSICFRFYNQESPSYLVYTKGDL